MRRPKKQLNCLSGKVLTDQVPKVAQSEDAEPHHQADTKTTDVWGT